MEKQKVKIICAECGSDNVRRDAYAEFDVDAQEWVLSTVFDQGYCEACGGVEERLEERPLALAESTAPDLLATLQDFAAWEPEAGVSIDDLGAWVRERAAAAIAKATGAA